MELLQTLTIFIALIVSLLAVFFILRYRNEALKLKERFSEVFDQESELVKLNKQVESISTEISKLQDAYKSKKLTFDSLQKEAAIYDETIQLGEAGIYRPSYNFDHSDEYKRKINDIKAKQKDMLQKGKAIICTTEWTVEGSASKGKKMSIDNGRMVAKAFNNECEAAISKVKWNNATRLIERINKAFNAVNKLNESNHIYIEDEYLELKINELKLTHEYHEKKQREKEEQSAIRQQMREEALLEKEMADSLKEESKYQNLLDKAKQQAEKANGEKLSALEERIAKLNFDLEQAHIKTERAKSMAEQTKAGHVYVISNIGSFGENIYKIGMTRRLEPLDRIRELGDASVPFLFDVHAMIYTDNAPELETTLHRIFNEKRVNLVNNRKEFFDISLKEIEEAVNNNFGEAHFYLTREAREYKETLAMRDHLNKEKLKTVEYPEAI